jgi:hypothetical protein
LRCGAPVQSGAPAASGGASPTPINNPARGKNWRLAATIATMGVAALALGAVYVRGQLMQKSGNATGGQLVQAPGNSGPSQMVQAPGDSQPRELVQAPTDDSVPADVLDYLAFLKRIEASRKQMENQQASQAGAEIMTSFADQLTQQMAQIGSDGEDNVKPKVNEADAAAEIKKVESQWNDLTVEFTRRAPPASCVPLHDAYYEFLGKVQASTVRVYGQLAKVKSITRDPSSSDKMQELLKETSGLLGRSGQEVDPFMHKADEELGIVCTRYKLKKDFDISESSSGLAGLATKIPGQ